MGRTAVTGALLGLLVLGTAGCAGSATPPVPPITDARDPGTVAACDLLPDGGRAALGLGAGTPGTAPEGPRCRWEGPAAVLEITVFAAEDALAVLAANSEPTTSRVRLAGFPALETFTGGGAFCQYDVAVADDRVLLAALDGGEPDACTALQGVLSGVLAALPPRG